MINYQLSKIKQMALNQECTKLVKDYMEYFMMGMEIPDEVDNALNIDLWNTHGDIFKRYFFDKIKNIVAGAISYSGGDSRISSCVEKLQYDEVFIDDGNDSTN